MVIPVKLLFYWCLSLFKPYIQCDVGASCKNRAIVFQRNADMVPGIFRGIVLGYSDTKAQGYYASCSSHTPGYAMYEADRIVSREDYLIGTVMES